jgi:hypothetical protein
MQQVYSKAEPSAPWLALNDENKNNNNYVYQESSAARTTGKWSGVYIRYEPNLHPVLNKIVGKGWEPVRRIPAGDTWFTSTDKLKGTFVTGSTDDWSKEWSVRYADNNFNQFLFVTDDAYSWLIVDKDQILGGTPADEKSKVVRSNIFGSSHRVKFNFEKPRVGKDTAPWIGLVDHAPDRDAQEYLMYAENSSG